MFVYPYACVMQNQGLCLSVCLRLCACVSVCLYVPDLRSVVLVCNVPGAPYKVYPAVSLDAHCLATIMSGDGKGSKRDVECGRHRQPDIAAGDTLWGYYRMSGAKDRKELACSWDHDICSNMADTH